MQEKYKGLTEEGDNSMEQITEHRIRRIMCCCGNGLGTSLFMQMTMEEALEKLDVSGVEVCFGSLADAMEGQADLFVVSEELERTLAGLPVLGLKDLSDADRAAKLLSEKFGM